MIRQAISCDLCATEKRQTNHWFVAYEQSGELRISSWNSRQRRRPDTKHLCGQTCIHKLVDEFMAKSIAVRPQRVADADEAAMKEPRGADASLTSGVAHGDPESPGLLLTPLAPVPPTPSFHPQAELVNLPSRPQPQSFVLRPGDKPRRNWRAEAWERERERELCAVENHPDIAD